MYCADPLIQIHITLPRITPEFGMGTRMKRFLTHAMSPELTVFLLDHSKKTDILMKEQGYFVQKVFRREKITRFLVYNLVKSFEAIVNKPESQSHFRFFADLKWESCHSRFRSKIKTLYNLSPRGLMENSYFKYSIFDERLEQE